MSMDRDDKSNSRYGFWKEVVGPGLKNLEPFFWNLLWFLVFVFLLFGFNPFH